MKLTQIILVSIFTVTPFSSIFCMNGDSPWAPVPSPDQEFENFWDWKRACDEHVKNPEEQTPLSFELFQKEINDFCASQDEKILKESSWVAKQKTYLPSYFVQKLEVDPGTEVAFFGDRHGDISSLNQSIEFLAKRGHLSWKNPFKISDKNFKMIMLGDYVDRGNYGAEVMYTLLRMKRMNPDQFFMTRGNHEDIDMNNKYGFSDELSKKFNTPEAIPFINSLIKKFYNKLPVALYLVVASKPVKNAILCCHAGPEPGFKDTKELLDAPKADCFAPLDILHWDTFAKKLSPQYRSCLRILSQEKLSDRKIISSQEISYLWADFNFEPSQEVTYPIIINNRPALEFPEQFTKHFLTIESTPTCIIRAIFRGHQHCADTMDRILNKDGMSDPKDAGVAKLWVSPGQKQPARKLWDGCVCTFCVAPNTSYGDEYDYSFDTIGILKTTDTFEAWDLAIHRIETKNEEINEETPLSNIIPRMHMLRRYPPLPGALASKGISRQPSYISLSSGFRLEEGELDALNAHFKKCFPDKDEDQ